MNIGKLKKFTLVDIKIENNEYKYIYLLNSKKFFKTFYFKLIFSSKLPFYLFTDIMKVMKNEGFFFEDLIDREIELSIGKVSVSEFSELDYDRYSDNHNSWISNFFDDAFNNQKKLQKEYENKFGYPDDLGLHEAWDA